MRPTRYTVDRQGPGRLSIMAKPRGGEWLEDEMAALKSCGVDILVCALTPAELDECGLAAEPHTARNAGLHFVPLPIPDRGVPDRESILPTLRHLAAELTNGAHILTHCRYGIGRASLLAASLLVLTGTAPTAAWNGVEKARGLPVPDTPEQRDWIGELGPVSG
ncbi:phosphatase domain-containing putative toxin [Nocardia concava]|uniref:phosphatase domain-containing putative toxin n=1 Tax=Nocardia concava TaxID=257281 RepID=UPI0002FD5885|nr:tyrosine protein phosphatase [Nocardia concava]